MTYFYCASSNTLKFARLYFRIIFLIICGLMLWSTLGFSIQKRHLSQSQRAVIYAAQKILESYEISYVYGGHRIGDAQDCDSCNLCLSEKMPSPKARQNECPICSSCSLDCSHFVNLVFNDAGMAIPYITSSEMSALSSAALKKKYHLLDLGSDVSKVRPGDLLIYRGHVVILEALTPMEIVKLQDSQSSDKSRNLYASLPIRGDVIHATGGGAIQTPGAGIQRQRFVDLRNFRGTLLRILRHESLKIAP